MINLEKAKGILFTTEEVKAILWGIKTAARKPIKNIFNWCDCKHEFVRDDFISNSVFTGFVCKKCGYGVSPPHTKYAVGTSFIRPIYQIGDILYVKETFCKGFARNGDNKIIYKADIETDLQAIHSWTPSIYMPKEIARIFLKIIDVRVERLQDIADTIKPKILYSGYKAWDISEILKEGIRPFLTIDALPEFFRLWNSGIKKKDIVKYGWKANPHVFVYEFERIKQWNE